jgi:two-component system, NtrC family, sensor histidine kinase PilS
MATRTLRQQLALQVAVRLAVATLLLGSAVVVLVRTPGALPVNPFFYLIGLVYAASLVFALTLRFVDRRPWLADLQFALDALIVSAFVYLTGGVTSIFALLYGLPIVAAALVQLRRGSLQVATLSAILYVGLVLAQYLDAAGHLSSVWAMTAPETLPPVSVALYTVAINVGAFFAVALLSGSLAEGRRRADVQLVRASAEIADLQAFNQHVLDNLVSGLATADESQYLLTFNQSAAAITGIPAGQAVGRPAADVLQLPPDFVAGMVDDLKTARTRRADYQFRPPGGGVIDLGLAAAHLPLPDGSRGFLFTFQDVTDLRRLERSDRLQQRLAAVGEMAAGIAHEIRNPLASMSGSMQVLRGELALSEEQAQLMDIVLRESDRLNETIKSLLAYARPQQVALQPLDLRPVVQDAATLLRNSPEVDEGHTIEVDVPDREVTVEADENQVRQIVWNLATNGLRAMRHGGRLRLFVALADRGAGEEALFGVEDEGTGIPDDESDAIFHPFRATFSGGTGLGLAVVHRIVSDHNGRIDVQSEVGRGTRVTIRFPVTATLRAPAAEAQLSVASSRATVPSLNRKPTPGRSRLE